MAAHPHPYVPGREKQPGPITAVIVLLWIQTGLLACGGFIVVHGLTMFFMGPEDDYRPEAGEALRSVLAEGAVLGFLIAVLVIVLASATLAVLVARRTRWAGTAVIVFGIVQLVVVGVWGATTVGSGLLFGPELVVGIGVPLATLILAANEHFRRWLGN